MDSRSETCLTGPCAITIRFVFTLCTLGSAFAQTTMLEFREPGATPSGQQVSLTEAGDHCTSTPGGLEGHVCGALGGDKITLSVVDQSSPSSGRDLGQRTQQFLDERLTEGKKSAVIWVLHPSDYRLPFPEMLNDMEFTIVHELVHLELASLPRSEASRSSEEHAVNGIAEALLALDHKKQ
jgi:hypothetical protein